MTASWRETAEDLKRIEGIHLALRLVEPEDAQYVYGLRTDPAYSTHLSPVGGTVEDQRTWIERYKEREAAGLEYYYVIERLDSRSRCGLVRLYDIEADRFAWGSWILDANKPPKAALESAVLSFGIGFDRLQKKLALIDVRLANTHARAFYNRFHMCQVKQNDARVYFQYSAKQYRADRFQHIEVVKRRKADELG